MIYINSLLKQKYLILKLIDIIWKKTDVREVKSPFSIHRSSFVLYDSH